MNHFFLPQYYFRTSILALSLSVVPLALPAHEAFVEDTPTQAPVAAGSSSVGTVTQENPFPEPARALLKQAVEQTSAGDLAGAKKTYQQMIQDYPEIGYARYARFLNLTNPEELVGFVITLEEEKSVPLMVRVKALLTINEPAVALRLIEQTPAPELESLSPEEKIQLLVSHSLALRQTGKVAVADSLIINSLRTVSPAERAIIADHFFTRLGAPLPTSAELLIPALDLGLIELGYNTMKNRELLDSILISQQQQGTYFDLSKSLLEKKETLGPVSLHLLIRMNLMEGRMAEASTLLAERGETFKQSPYYVELLKERVALLESTFEFEAATKLNDEIRALEKRDTDAPQVETFLKYMRTNQFEEAEKVKPDQGTSLQEPKDRELIKALVEFAAWQQDIENTITLYAALPESIKRDERTELHKEIFKQFINTAQHLSIEKRIRTMFEENPTGTTPSLWLLAAAAAAESKLKPNEIEARYQYILLAPNDIEELEALAMESSRIALELGTAPDEELIKFEIPLEERTRFVSLAKASLESLMQARPYTPEPMEQLIRIYKQAGDEEKAKAVPKLIAETTTNVDILKTCGLVLSLEGFPEEGILYYDRALKIEPNNFDVLTNRAAAYTRLGRWDEAEEFYKLALVKGFDNKPWHNHDYILRLWSVAEAREQQAEMKEYFRTVAEDKSIPWNTQILDNLAALFMKSGQLDEAEYYARKILQEELTPSHRLKVWEKLVGSVSKDPDKAESFYKEALKQLEKEPSEFSIITTSYCRFLSDQGRDAEAIERLLALNNSHTTPEAMEAAFYAAFVAEKIKNPTDAIKYYQQFLATKSVNFMLRSEAEKRVAELTKTPEEKPQ